MKKYVDPEMNILNAVFETIMAEDDTGGISQEIEFG